LSKPYAQPGKICKVSHIATAAIRPSLVNSSACGVKRERWTGHPSHIVCFTLCPRTPKAVALSDAKLFAGRRFGQLITFPFARSTLKIAFGV
jgi:hypothetical protein